MTALSTQTTLLILDLFQGKNAELSTEEIATALGKPISTCYRYLKVMSDMGYLVSTSGSGYSLGPKIMLLGFHLQRNDPVIAVTRKHAENMVRNFHGTAAVNRVFRQSFICIYTTHSKNEKRTGFGPGDSMPILFGANAMVIQAFMSRHLQKKLYDENQERLAKGGRGATFQEFKDQLAAVKLARVWKVDGAIRPDSTGIVAPLLGLKGQILGTFSFSVPTEILTPEMEETLKLRVHEIGIRASEELGRNA